MSSYSQFVKDDLEMSEARRFELSKLCWAIEEYHGGIKQFAGIERSQVHSNKALRNHIGLALRAFLRIKRYCFRTGLSWFGAKIEIIRSAMQAYLENPLYQLAQTA